MAAHVPARTDATALRHDAGVVPATPLWQRLPKRDAEGRRLGDFMMLIPGLRQSPPRVRQTLLARLDAVLRERRDTVAYADLNLKLNLLWVSVSARPHAWREVAEAVRAVLPQARLISPEGPATHRPRRRT